MTVGLADRRLDGSL